MKDLNFEEAFKLLEEQGWKPMLCDTPVLVYDNPVNCGIPKDVGDLSYDYNMMPHDYWPPNRIFMVPAFGDSMRDADIHAGDLLTILTEARFMDDDMVLVNIDGECTVKAYFEDDDGGKWLVPYNDKYDAIKLSETDNVYVVGKVVGVTRQHPRVRHRDSERIVRAFKEKNKVDRKLSGVELSDIIRSIASQIEAGRQWFAVYKPLAVKKQVPKGDYDGFCTLVRETVPDHAKLPTAVELERMDVLSFSKPVALWDPTNAPVKGKRFLKYKKVGEAVMDMIALKL